MDPLMADAVQWLTRIWPTAQGETVRTVVLETGTPGEYSINSRLILQGDQFAVTIQPGNPMELLEKFKETTYKEGYPFYGEGLMARNVQEIDAKIAEYRALMAQIADSIRKDIQKKKAQLADKARKVKEEKAKADNLKKNAVQKEIVRLIGDASKNWASGLDSEAKSLTRADRAWRASETSLLKAKRLTAHMIKNKDVDTIKAGKKLDAEVDSWLVKTYFRLGRMWAVELAYPKALAWLNKGIKVPHNELMDALLNDLLVQVSKIKMRERGAARGY